MRLTEIFRQAQKSLIVRNAHRIVQGEAPRAGGKEDDFFMLESFGPACQRLVCDLVSARLPRTYGLDPVRDIQVLCATKVGPTGSVELNRRLQAVLNPPAPGKPQIAWEQSGRVLRLGDKVMQIKNDYDIPFERGGAGEAGVGAYNGDLGVIVAVDPETRSVVVEMDDRRYTYGADQLNELEPAYAVTIHKSQGSEFPAVVMPLADVPARLCYRNLLYTGVTRARRLCVLAGTGRTVQAMVQNVRQNLRYSCLRYLLAQAAGKTAVRAALRPLAERLAAMAWPRRCPLCGALLGPDAVKGLLCPACAPWAEKLAHTPPRLVGGAHEFYALTGAASAFYYRGRCAGPSWPARRTAARGMRASWPTLSPCACSARSRRRPRGGGPCTKI